MKNSVIILLLIISSCAPRPKGENLYWYKASNKPSAYFSGIFQEIDYCTYFTDCVSGHRYVVDKSSPIMRSVSSRYFDISKDSISILCRFSGRAIDADTIFIDKFHGFFYNLYCKGIVCGNYKYGSSYSLDLTTNYLFVITRANGEKLTGRWLRAAEDQGILIIGDSLYSPFTINYSFASRSMILIFKSEKGSGIAFN